MLLRSEDEHALITVVVPAFNAEATLSDCLDSIVAQTYESLQIIVVNDGSGDGTGQLLESYGRRYTAIEVFTTSNEGTSAARNLGIDHAKGDYLMFVDADDTLHPEAIEQLFKALVSTNSDLATAGHLQQRDGGVVIRKSGEVNADRLFTDVELYQYVLEYMREPYTYTMVVHCWNKLYKRSILRNGIQFNPELTQFEDVDFNFRYLIHCKQICYKASFLYNHRITSQLVSLSNLTGNENDALEKFWLAYQSLAVYLKKHSAGSNDLDIDQRLGHLYVTTVIISLIRLSAGLNMIGIFKLWKRIQYITYNQRLRNMLKYYSPSKNDSRCIYFALKIRSPFSVLVFAWIRGWVRKVRLQTLFAG